MEVFEVLGLMTKIEDNVKQDPTDETTRDEEEDAVEVSDSEAK